MRGTKVDGYLPLHQMSKVEKRARKLSRKLSRFDIRWPSQPERRGLGRLLANNRAIEPVLEFLKNTKESSRVEGKERKLESQGRINLKGEDLLSN